MHCDAAARHHQVDRLIVLRLGEPHRLLGQQHARLAQPRAEPGKIFQRADAAVDVDRSVGFGVAGILDGDGFVFGAVGRERIGDRAKQLRALGIAQRAQGPLPLLACEGERALEVDALGGGGGDHLAAHRVNQRSLDPIPARPAPRHVAVKRLRIHGWHPGFAKAMQPL